jgi:uroporphyrinogen-III synthase
MRRLIVLRPEPGASATAGKARAVGLTVETVPLFAVQPVHWRADADDYDAIVATSANAIRHGGGGLASLRKLPVHAVGEATAQAARDAGFTLASIGQGGAREMPLPAGRLLHLAGRDHHPIAGATTVIVYESVAIEPPPSLAAEDAVVMVHSARAGERLAELVVDRASTMIVAISAAAAGACGAGWQLVAIAGEPSDSALLALARDLCQKQ